MAQKKPPQYTATQALAEWQKNHPDEPIEDVVEVGLQFNHPPITVMSDKLAQLAACKKLMISTNNIQEIKFLPPRIEVLSIGRNLLTKLTGIEKAAATLTQLWMSYNSVKDLRPIAACKRLTVLYLAHNKVEKQTELDHIQQLPDLSDLLLTGNPVVETISKNRNYRAEMCRRCKKLQILDGAPTTDADRGDTSGPGVPGDTSSQKTTTGNTTTGNQSGAQSSGNGSRAVSPRA